MKTIRHTLAHTQKLFEDDVHVGQPYGSLWRRAGENGKHDIGDGSDGIGEAKDATDGEHRGLFGLPEQVSNPVP